MTVRDPLILERITEIKRDLARAITADRVFRPNLTQREFAKLTGLHQGDVSHLLAGQRLHCFSVDRLIMVLIRLGHDVTVQVN